MRSDRGSRKGETRQAQDEDRQFLTAYGPQIIKHSHKVQPNNQVCKLILFIHSGHFYSAPSSPVPLRGAPDYSTDTVSEFHAEAHRQLQVKDLLKVPT